MSTHEGNFECCLCGGEHRLDCGACSVAGDVCAKGAEIMTVREICERYTLTQTALAKRFDIPLRTVQDWYAGKRVPPPYVVKMMVELIERGDGAV